MPAVPTIPPTRPTGRAMPTIAYDAKYGFRDPRGGGRASARETAMRVAGGAVARLVIPEVEIAAAVVEIGGEADESRWETMLDEARAAGDSLGAIVECVAIGVPGRMGRPDLRQTRCRAGGGLYGHQRREGRRARRGICCRPIARQRKCGWQSSKQASWRDRRRHLDRQLWSGAFKPTSSIRVAVRASSLAARRMRRSRAVTIRASGYAARRSSRRWLR